MMDTYAMHLAMAALVGASVVAVSAFYMHRKTLNQLLELASLRVWIGTDNKNLKMI